MPGVQFRCEAGATITPFDAAPGVHMTGTAGLAQAQTGADGTLTIADLPTTQGVVYDLIPPSGSGYNAINGATTPDLTDNDHLIVQMTPVQAPTTTTLASAPDASAYGQEVTFTATVAASTTPGGTITFYECASPASLPPGSPASSCAIAVPVSAQAVNASGQASYQTSTLPAGPTDVFAQFTPADPAHFAP